jgi:hypothetical protein
MTVDLNIPTFFSSPAGWGFPTYYALSAYNDVTPAVDPVTGEHVLLIGFEAIVSPTAPVPQWTEPGTGNWTASASYLIRHANGTYEVREIDAPNLEATGTPASVPHSTRAMALSPFPQDQGNVVYAGGFDCDQVPAHDTAWGAVAPLGRALGH